MGERWPEIEVVLFDADGVLQRRAAEDPLIPALAALLPDPAQADGFVAEVFRVERSCLSGSDDFAQAMATVLRRWGCRADVAEALRIWQRIAVDPEVLNVVRQVRASGCRVGLATNQWPERVFFIDDHDANVNAAIAAGLRAALFPAAGGAAHLGRLLAEQGVTPVQV
jgi:FMN phosphatase YigB (HAD superfamily)